MTKGCVCINMSQHLEMVQLTFYKSALNDLSGERKANNIGFVTFDASYISLPGLLTFCFKAVMRKGGKCRFYSLPFQTANLFST